MKTNLIDRELWFDGKITIEPRRLLDYINYIDDICVTEINKDITQYNRLMTCDKQIRVKTHLTEIQNEWLLPKEYVELDVEQYIFDCHQKVISDSNWSTDEIDARNVRVTREVALFKKNNLIYLLRALIYIINKLKQCDEVWGTGRGSSVSSYILFILEVHDVDSFLYELSITDFIK